MGTLAERFKRARVAAGLSQADLARATGISTAGISLIETGQTRSLKAKSALAIEKATGFSSRWLETGLGPEKIDNPAGVYAEEVQAIVAELTTDALLDAVLAALPRLSKADALRLHNACISKLIDE